MHPGCVEIFIHATAGMHAIKSADHVMINHIDHRLGHRLVDLFKGIHPFLDQHIRDRQALLHHRHFIALLAVQPGDFAAILHRHDAHAVSACVGFDDDERILLHAILGIFDADFLQHNIHLRGETFLPDTLLKIDLIASGEIWVDQPRVDVEQLGEFVCNAIIRGEML